MRWAWTSLFLIACGATAPEVPASECEAELPDAEVLSLLFVIDNGGYVLPEQVNLSEQLSWLIHALTTGDADGDGVPETPPFREVRLGVVTTDMGTGGHEIPTCAEAEHGDEGVLRTEVTMGHPDCPDAVPSFLVYRTDDGVDSDAIAEQLSCTLVTGNDDGCGFEQPLEAALKAVTPSSSDLRFFGDTRGHADLANAGFLDPSGALAIVIMDDEDDGSVADPELFRTSGGAYEGSLLIRPVRYPSALHPVTRYVDGLIAAAGRPERLAFGVIAGVPGGLAPANDADEYRALLDDTQMQQVVDPTDSNRLTPSCNTPVIGLAFPPRRLVQVALGLAERGTSTAVGTLCLSDLRPPLLALLESMSRPPPARAECADGP